MRTLFLSVVSAICLLNCTVASVVLPQTLPVINGPIGVAAIEVENTPYFFVINSNYTLNFENGSLIAYQFDKDLSSVQVNDYIEIDRFGALIAVDESVSRLYVTNRLGDSVDIYDYEINSSGGLSLSEANVSNNHHQVSVGENPYGMAILRDGPVDDQLWVANLSSAEISIISLDTYEVLDLTDSDEDVRGLILDTTTSPFSSQGLGVSRIEFTEDKRFALATTFAFNVVYVIDVVDQDIEGVIYLDDDGGNGGQGSRDIVIQDNIAYITNRFTDSIYMIDLTQEFENQINNDVIEGSIINVVSSFGEDPSGIALTANNIYVCNFTSNQVAVIDRASNQLLALIDVGYGPSEIEIVGQYAIINSFYSDTLSVIDTTTNMIVASF